MRAAARTIACAAACGLACGRVGFDPTTHATGDGAGGDGAALAVVDTHMLPSTAVAIATVPAGAAVAWSALDGGSIDATGTFHAPDADGTYHVQATAGGVTATGTITVTRDVAASAIANVGQLAKASGMAHQHHVARVDGVWWVWTVAESAPTQLLARSSPDFATWSDGAALSLGSAVDGDGRNLDVAVAALGGHEVVHVALAFEPGRGRYHARGTLDGGALAWGAPQLINEGGVVSPDGPSVVVTASGRVIDGTGYLQTPQNPPLNPCGDGDLVMYTADQLDDGTTSFDAMTWTQQVVWCVPNRSNARRLLADGETVYQLFDDGFSDPNPQNLLVDMRLPDGTWLPDETTFTTPPRAFGSDTSYLLDDWDAVIAGRTLHAARRLDFGTSSSFDHRTLDLDAAPGTAWVDGAPIEPDTTTAGTGLVLEPYGTGVIALQLSPGGDLRYTFLDGATWSPWATIPLPSANPRGFLAGGAAPEARPAMIWTELTTAGNVLTGVQLP